MHLLGDFGGIQRDLMAHSNEMKKDSSSETHCSKKCALTGAYLLAPAEGLPASNLLTLGFVDRFIGTYY